MMRQMATEEKVTFPSIKMPVNMLLEMMNKQFAFQTENQYDPRIHEVASAIMSEGGELWAIAGGKWWKEYLKKQGTSGHYNRINADSYIKMVEKENHDKIFEESIDVLHFLLTVWIQLKVTPQEVFDKYIGKMDVNKKRQKDHY